MARPKVDPEKRQRIAHACDTCKRRKQKCDGEKPCGRCTKIHGGRMECTYGTDNERFNHTPPPKRELTGFASAPYTTRSQTSPTDFGITTPSATPSYQHSWSPIAGGNGSSPFFPNTDFFGNMSESMGPRLSTQEPVAASQQAKTPSRPQNVISEKKRKHTSDQNEEAEASGNSRMLLNPTGRLMYFGDSAALSFLQLIRMMVENIAGPSGFTTDPNRHRIVEASVTLPPNFHGVRLLPAKETVIVLAESFFTNVNGLLELFNRESFLSTIDDYYTNKLEVDPQWLCSLYLILAVGLLMAAPMQGSPQYRMIEGLRDNKINQAEIFYLEAMHLQDPSEGFVDANFWRIQALAMMALYHLTICNRTGAYAYHGMAVRSAYSLGLHRKESYQAHSQSEGLLRSNVWKSLFVLEIFLATSLGRPTVITGSNCPQIKWPATERSESQAMPLSPSTDIDSPTTEALALDAAVQCSHVIGATLETVYTVRKISAKSAQEIIDKAQNKKLDPILNIRKQASSTHNHGIAILHVNLLLCHSAILIGRPFLLYLMKKDHAEGNNGPRRLERKTFTQLELLAEACVASSISTISLAQTAYKCQHLPRTNPFILYFLFSASLVVLSNELSTTFVNVDADPAINDSILIMEHFAKFDSQAQRLLVIMKSFRNVVRRQRIIESSRSGPGHHISQPRHDLPSETEPSNVCNENSFGKSMASAPSSIGDDHFRAISNSSMALPFSHVSPQFQNALHPPTYFANDNSPHPQDASLFPIGNFLGVQTSTLEPIVASQGEYDDSDGVEFDSLLPDPSNLGMVVGSGNGTWGNGGFSLESFHVFEQDHYGL